MNAGETTPPAVRTGSFGFSSFGLSKAQRQNASLVKDGSMSGHVRNVVQLPFGFLESSEEPSNTAIRTPCLGFASSSFVVIKGFSRLRLTRQVIAHEESYVLFFFVSAYIGMTGAILVP